MTGHRATTANQDVTGRQEAARMLLARPILTQNRHPDQLALVRRHATGLKSMFASTLGYHLVVESSFARLVKSPLPESAPTRPARRPSDGARFSTATYTHLALICAALLAPGIGEQILISALVDQLRADAAEQGITVSDTLSDRRQLVMALGLLLDWGVLSETDGSVTAWGERRQDEALLTVHRPLLALILPNPLHQWTTAEQTWEQPAEDQPRRRLRRRLVESPVLLRTDLDDQERDILSRERTEMTRQLEENFGLTLEVRAEGVLAYDATGSLTDVDFPGVGSLKQAALLLLDQLVAATEPGSDNTAFAPWAAVDRLLAQLTVQYGKGWRDGYVDSPRRLREEVVELLQSLTLAQATEDGLAVFAVAARYRPVVTGGRK